MAVPHSHDSLVNLPGLTSEAGEGLVGPTCVSAEAFGGGAKVAEVTLA